MHRFIDLFLYIGIPGASRQGTLGYISGEAAFAFGELRGTERDGRRDSMAFTLSALGMGMEFTGRRGMQE